MIDLHVHTTEGSRCSRLQPEEMIAAAEAKGLDAICLTEHDMMWSTWKLQSLQEKSRIRLFRGMEVTTNLGHVLALGLPGYISGIFNAGKLREIADRYNAYLIGAHPCRIEPGEPLTKVNRLVEIVDALEVENGSNLPAENREAYLISQKYGLPGLAGSDAHSYWQVGTKVVELDFQVGAEAELVEVLRSGKFKLLV